MSTTEPFRSQLMLSERSQNQRPGRRQSSHPRRAPCLGAVSTFAIQADGTCRGRLPAFGDLPVMLSTKSLTDSTGVPCDGRRPPRRDRGERNRTSHSCLSDARAALGLGDRVLHCWGSIPFRNVRQPHLFSDSRRRKLPFPLPDLLGHHGVYFALLMSCPLWVISGHWSVDEGCPFQSQERTCSAPGGQGGFMSTRPSSGSAKPSARPLALRATAAAVS
jgi:hypothetical protein